jgi:hypothetical protein
MDKSEICGADKDIRFFNKAKEKFLLVFEENVKKTILSKPAGHYLPPYLLLIIDFAAYYRTIFNVHSIKNIAQKIKKTRKSYGIRRPDMFRAL